LKIEIGTQYRGRHESIHGPLGFRFKAALIRNNKKGSTLIILALIRNNKEGPTLILLWSFIFFFVTRMKFHSFVSAHEIRQSLKAGERKTIKRVVTGQYSVLSSQYQ
jgi:hypothetical protein